ncbi:MAG TPA: hypothetical protein PKA42_01260 [Candidatus Paceibacterota bacterium]|nr:hypothetical protein [Candidatus Paceibacterota bacterium]HMO82772.1 hypothetical protein [Candidatus Paceibacterota bacterium]
MRAQRKFVSFFGLGSIFAAPLFYSYLKAHPQICVPQEELDFFCQPKLYAQGIEWYEGQFGKCETGFIYGELSGYYLQNAQAASLIARTYPNAKLLAVIENPLVSVKVAYIEAKRAGLISSKISLALFLKQYPEVLSSARYGQQLVHYFGYYSPTDLLVVTAGDVREDPLSVIKTAYAYLGVSDDFVPGELKHLFPEEEIDPKKRPGFIKRGLKAIKQSVTNKYHAILQHFHPKIVPIETASIAARAMTLTPELESYLKDYFRSDVTVLSRLMHRDLNAEWEIPAKDKKVL